MSILPEELQVAAKQIRHIYYEQNKASIQQSQKKYREKEKTEEQRQKTRDYANSYYNKKIKTTRQNTPKTEEQKQKMRDYARQHYLAKKNKNMNS
jgi:hypothetical protein